MKSIREFIRKYSTHYLMLVPFFALFAVFFFWPIIYGIFMSFTKWKIGQAHVFVGFDNYKSVIQSVSFTKGIRNVLIYFLCAIPLGVGSALFIALLVSKFKGFWHQFFRATFFLPFVIPMFLSAGIWRWMFTPQFGIINVFLSSLGVPDVKWLSNPTVMIFAVLIVDMWRALGFNMVLFLAGIKAISPEYYEAARLDGANTIQQMTHITIPLLEPVFFLVIVNAFISIIQIFDVPWLLSRSDYNTQGGARQGMLFPVMDMMGLSFGKQRFDEASTYAVILLIFALLVTVMQFAIRRRYKKI